MSAERIPDWGAQLDQMKASLVDFASILYSYFTALVAAGFEAEQAMRLTIAWQAETLRGLSSGGGEPDD